MGGWVLFMAHQGGGGEVIPNLICVHNITANKPSATGITAHNPVAANIARVEC